MTGLPVKNLDYGIRTLLLIIFASLFHSSMSQAKGNMLHISGKKKNQQPQRLPIPQSGKICKDSQDMMIASIVYCLPSQLIV